VASVARFDTWQAADGTNVARFNSGELQVWDGAAWAKAGGIAVEYVIVAGGAGGGACTRDGSFGVGGPGGGAGGYRSNVLGENTGGGVTAENSLLLAAGTYPITVGAGGAGAAYQGPTSSNGSDTNFGQIIAIGGGGAAGRTSIYGTSGSYANDGGSGGAGQPTSGFENGGAGYLRQGFAGGYSQRLPTLFRPSAGGGGASQIGYPSTSTQGGAGGDGVSSSITGSAVTRAGGGGGGAGGSGNLPGAGGAGGGGAGGDLNTTNAAAGTANTGGGGGGAGGGTSGAVTAPSGGSGVIIMSLPSSVAVSFSVGVTQSSSTVGANTVYEITAAGATDTVTIG